MIFNSYVKLPEGTWTIKQSTALGIKQLKHMERLATSRCFWTQLVASAKFLPNWNCVLIANMIFVNWNGQSELKPPKYIYHITYISLAIMPIAFHRKTNPKKKWASNGFRQKPISRASHLQGGSAAVMPSALALLSDRWPDSLRSPWCSTQHVLGCAGNFFRV